MKKDQPASRELDALVAEKVMGWHCDGEFNWRDKNNVTQDWVDDWKPSTNISDAWQVVEKMRGRGLLVHIIFDHTYDRHNWEVGFNNPNIMAEDCNYSYEETAPLAIVKAALEALNDS